MFKIFTIKAKILTNIFKIHKGRIATVGMSHYAMSKHAARVFSDVARRELAEQDISVVVIEPIFYKTNIIDFEQITRTRQRIFDQSPDYIKADYSDDYQKKLFARTKARIQGAARTNVSEVIDAMETAVTLAKPKPYYRCCGYLDLITTWAVGLLPEAILDALIYYKMQKV